MVNKQFIRKEDVKALIESVKKGKFFSMHFERVSPKCETCNKSSKKWVGLETCPICGAVLSFERETIAQKGVENPANPADKPNGLGISAKDALEMNWVKYYDCNAINKDGSKGGYRSCRLENIKRITIDKVQYFIV
jgi:hypothetical protein